jgi:hypothetical protein
VTLLAAAWRTSVSAAFSAFWRNAFFEESENWETTMAVEVAATTAKATPNHQRTPMKGFGTAQS